jgi:hypothetical protein
LKWRNRPSAKPGCTLLSTTDVETSISGA